MKKNILRILYTFVIVTGSFFVFDVNTADAACVVTSANFRVVNATGTPTQISPDTWYNDTNPPYVYIDFQTTGCVTGDAIFQLSITELDDANGLNNGNDDDISGFDNRPVSVNPSAPNFSYVLRAGDAQCESLTTHPFECQYYIRINDSVVGNINSFNLTSNLKYNCSSGCNNRNWQYVTEIAYQSTYPADLALQNSNNNNNNNQGSAGPGIAGQEIDINIQNPIGSNDMTIIDFITTVINFALKIGIPIIAIAIIYSGLLFVTARGDSGQLETARNAFTYAVIGGAILLGCWIFAELIKETIESIVMINQYFG